MANLLDFIKTQELIFQEVPKRHELMQLEIGEVAARQQVRVHRNHSFEHVSSLIDKFLGVYKVGIDWVYSDYDDSLTFQEPEADHDLEIIWLDYHNYEGRLSSDAFCEWLCGRVGDLRVKSHSPILISVTGTGSGIDSKISGILKEKQYPGVHYCSDECVRAQLGGKYFDLRAARFSGTRLSDRACVLLAREFSYKWLYASWYPRLKAIAVDLDHTLYSGVLGEDGLAVELSLEHRKLQEKLIQHKDNGFFLAIVSRNEESDVRELFNSRHDFPLKWDDFHVHCVNWNPKSSSITSVSKSLKIGESAILFIDDNPGELVEVNSTCPGVSILHAGQDTSLTLNALEFHPGLFGWGGESETDRLRGKDIVSERERMKLLSTAGNQDDYLASLGIELEVLTSISTAEASRVHEMSQKTNQFNLNFQRLSEVETNRLVHSNEHAVALIRLKDRLSDSGIIGMVVGADLVDKVLVTELNISCRALGRRIENVLCGLLMKSVRDKLGRKQIAIQYKTGPRNAPGLTWLAEFSGQDLGETGEVDLTAALDAIDFEAFPVRIAWK